MKSSEIPDETDMNESPNFNEDILRKNKNRTNVNNGRNPR